MWERIVAGVLMFVAFSCALHAKQIKTFLELRPELLRTYYLFLDNRIFCNKYFKGPFIKVYFTLRGWSLQL